MMPIRSTLLMTALFFAAAGVLYVAGMVFGAEGTLSGARYVSMGLSLYVGIHGAKYLFTRVWPELWRLLFAHTAAGVLLLVVVGAATPHFTDEAAWMFVGLTAFSLLFFLAWEATLAFVEKRLEDRS